jgi:nucleotide-binding universal stress UspA family protein
VTAAVLAGPVAATLGARAREIGAALVVMATHGRSGVARALLGSVAEAVVRDVAVPVLLVKPAPGAAPDDELAPPFRRVVVPLDGDAPAEAALDAALAIAPASDATYVLVRVIPAAGGAPHHEPSIDGAPPEAARLEADRVRAAEYLDGIARGMRARGVQVETETIAAPRAADGILACAAERNADLIALATRAPRGAARVLIGSVGDDVLRGARCAVLLARVAG